MINHLTQTLCSTVLILCTMQFVQESSYKYVLSGRVVDEQGKPVAHAVVTLNPPEKAVMDNAATIDDLIATYETDYEGRFRIEGESSFPSVQKALLYAMPPLPPNVYAPITQPFGDVRGQPITIKKNMETDVGEIPLNVRYGTMIVHLQDCTGNPLLTEKSQWPKIKLRIRDARGDIIVNSDRISPQAIREDDSSFVVALPQGTWHIGISLNGKDNSWVSSDYPLTLNTTATSLQATLRLSASESQSKTFCTRNSTSKVHNSNIARRELRQLGITFNEDSFVERAARGNVDAVRLFLAAGMDPHVKDKQGNTALIAASGNGYIDIVKVLLDKGAAVDLTNKLGDTALIAASSLGNSKIVRALLEKGADPNAKANNGVTPLIAAAGNNHIEVVEALLAADADINARSNEGMTALDFAAQSGNEKLIWLLRKATSQNNRAKSN